MPEWRDSAGDTAVFSPDKAISSLDTALSASAKGDMSLVITRAASSAERSERAM